MAKLREYLKNVDASLGARAEELWRKSAGLHERLTKPDDNANGAIHLKCVEDNIYQFLKQSQKIDTAGNADAFSPMELFILSAGACCHDYDKGLGTAMPASTDGSASRWPHGEGSGRFVVDSRDELGLEKSEAIAVDFISSVHNEKGQPFKDKLSELPEAFPIPSHAPINLQRLAIVLKAADTLHTDATRVPSLTVDAAKFSGLQRDKFEFRNAITGWCVTDQRTVTISTFPDSTNAQSAVEAGAKFMTEQEWAPMAEGLLLHGFPDQLKFNHSSRYLSAPQPPTPDPSAGGPAIAQALKSDKSVADYSPNNPCFNVPFQSKGDRMLGRAAVVGKIREKLQQGSRTAVGHAAAFQGLGGLGKTQSAVEYAHEHRADYPSGVIWLFADQDIDAQLTRLAVDARWVADASEHKVKLDVALNRLRNLSGGLIIFDNVENLAKIQPYLPTPAMAAHILITSRESRAGFSPVPLEALNPQMSLDLLLQEADRTPPDEQGLAAAREIARRLDGLPLALELAGAYLRHRSSLQFADYLELLTHEPMDGLKGDHYASFTGHDANLEQSLRVSESVFNEEPLLLDILDLLTWSGASAMGLSLMVTLLDVPDWKLKPALALGVDLRLLYVETATAGKRTIDGHRIHRLVQQVRRKQRKLDGQTDWVSLISQRMARWFRERREDVMRLPEYEHEIDHLTAWGDWAEQWAQNDAACLRWLLAYPPYHQGRYGDSLNFVERAEKHLGSATGNDRLKADLERDRAYLLYALGRFNEAVNHAEASLAICRRLFGDSHPDIAMSLNNVGGTYGALGQHQKALEYKLQALEICRATLGESHPTTAMSLNNVGGTYGALGQHQKAMEYELQALEIRRASLGKSHPETATSLDSVGTTYGGLGQHHKALEYLLQALEIGRAILGESHPTTAASLNNVGCCYGALGQHQKALDYMLQALERRRATLGESHPETATSLNNVGSTYGELGQHQKALEYMLQALEIRRVTLGDSHPETAASLNNVGSTYGELGQHQKALEYMLLALEIRRAALGESHPTTAMSLNNVGGTYAALGQHQKALDYMLQALEICRATLGESHPETATSLNNVGSTYGGWDQHQKALEYKLQALAICRATLGERHPTTAMSLNNVGSTYGALGQHQKALEYKLQALDICRATLGEFHPTTATSLNNVGRTYGELGQHQKALEYMLQALEIRRATLARIPTAPN